MSTDAAVTNESRQVVQGWLDALMEGDFEKMNSFYSDDCVMFFPGDTNVVPWAGEKNGIDEIVECFLTVAETLDIRSHDFKHIIAEGENVVVLGFEVSANKKTDYEFSQNYAWHFQVRDGKIVLYRLFEDTEAIANAYTS